MLRLLAAACLLLASASALAQSSDPAAPKGRLPDAARPVAYRLDLTVLPDQPTFAGRDEIDVVVKAPTSRLYMHGKDLKVSSSTARVGGRTIPATWTEVDPTGVVRLDFASPLPAGPATLAFNYQGTFRDTPSGLYRVKVGDKWYGWTQFQAIDARAAFPSFDEPGYKTPFTITVTTRKGEKAVSNAPEVAQSDEGGLTRHRFAPTKPLPTYLVAVMAGPFIDAKGAVPPTAVRPKPLPLGAFATQAQAGKLDYVMAETPRIVSLLEDYFGQAFPFEKLDQIASPIMPGAMENAGADTYADSIILLDPGAPTTQRQTFGMVVAHELAHQWFGDLVSPAWWDDLWLNESFANWMGYRIGDAWRPELNIGAGALQEGFIAMNTDALEVGRPIHQPIRTNGEIDSAFDAITYGKGGHVISMIAAYMGDAKFRDGVRLHLSRHPYGNATSEQFFQTLADAAKDQRVVAAMRSFVDQEGVPVVDFRRDGGKLIAVQSRYAFLGSRPEPKSWTIPLCLRTSDARQCVLLDKASMTLDAPAGPLMPNAGGTGYYRFNLEPADWQALIGQGASLPAPEAIAATDSLWAAFRAGKTDARMLVDATRAMAVHPDSRVAVDGGQRFAGLVRRGLIGPDARPTYARQMGSIFAPRLAAIGFDPAAGAHASDTPDRQSLRETLVDLVAGEAEDPATRTKLLQAAQAYLGGNEKALDQAFLATALLVFVEQGGQAAAESLFDKALASEDAVFRPAALAAVAESGRPEIGQWLIGRFDDKRLRPTEMLSLVTSLAATPETRDMAETWTLANFDRLVAAAGGLFGSSRAFQSLSFSCSIERARAIEAQIGAKVRQSGVAVLPFERMVENIRHCSDLRAAKASELSRALS